MRVRRFSLIRLRDEERGAVAALVAICLICLIGMLVLVFDLGHGVALKRNMVNGADAGALAAARECGMGNGEVTATQAATNLVGDNNDAATLLPGSDGFRVDPQGAQCNGSPGLDGSGVGRVTVGATVPVEYYFAPIFGFNNGTVVASATAEWTAGVQNPVPLKLDLLNVEDCTKDENGLDREEGYSGPECYFEFEKAKTGSQRGWLNLPEGWPIEGQDANPMDCTSNKGGSNDLVDYIDRMGLEGEGGFMPHLWDQPPTYVCAAGGVPNTAVQAIVAWLNTVAEMDLDPPPVVYFPVVACDGATAPCYPWITTPESRYAYPVIDLKGFRVEGAEQGNPRQWPDDMKENCQFERKSSDVFCIQLSVAGPAGQDLGGAVIVRLVD